MERRRDGGQSADAIGSTGPAPDPAEHWRGERTVAFWYRVGEAGPRVVQAADEDAAREAVLARHPEAAGQRFTLEPYRL